MWALEALENVFGPLTAEEQTEAFGRRVSTLPLRSHRQLRVRKKTTLEPCFLHSFKLLPRK